MIELKLKSFGNSKIETIKLIKDFTGLGLKESKDLADNIPSILVAKDDNVDIDYFIRKFESIRAEVEMLSHSAMEEPLPTLKIRLVNAGHYKIEVVKLVRMFTGLGLKDSKDLVDNVPSILSIKNNDVTIEQIIKNFEAIGARVEDLEDNTSPPAMAAGGNLTESGDNQEQNNTLVRDLDKQYFKNSQQADSKNYSDNKLVIKQAVLFVIFAAMAKTLLYFVLGYITFYLIYPVAIGVALILKNKNKVAGTKAGMAAFGIVLLYYFAGYFSDWLVFFILYKIHLDTGIFGIISGLFTFHGVMVIIAALLSFFMCFAKNLFTNESSNGNKKGSNLIENKRISNHKVKKRF